MKILSTITEILKFVMVVCLFIVGFHVFFHSKDSEQAALYFGIASILSYQKD